MTKNNNMKIIVDDIVKIMEKNNCRVMDQDILMALNRTTYDTDGMGGIINIKVDVSDLYKFKTHPTNS